MYNRKDQFFLAERNKDFREMVSWQEIWGAHVSWMPIVSPALFMTCINELDHDRKVEMEFYIKQAFNGRLSDLFKDFDF